MELAKHLEQTETQKYKAMLFVKHHCICIYNMLCPCINEKRSSTKSLNPKFLQVFCGLYFWFLKYLCSHWSPYDAIP